MNTPSLSTRPNNQRADTATNTGVMLIELLVATTIGLFLITGAFKLYSQTRQLEYYSDTSFQLRENTNFALNLISHDLRMANFWGRHTTATHIVLEPNIAVSCRGKDVSTWALNLAAAVETNRNGYTPPCGPHTPTANSDVLTVRYAGPSPSEPRENWLQLYTDQRWGYLHARSTPSPTGLINPANFYMVIRSYYVDSAGQEEAPELRRWSLGKNGTLRNELVIDGIKSLRVQFAENPQDAAAGTWLNEPGRNASLARIEITATGQYAGSRIEHTTSRIIHLKNSGIDTSSQSMAHVPRVAKRQPDDKQPFHLNRASQP
jgi:type II secretory pathway component PulJ